MGRPHLVVVAGGDVVERISVVGLLWAGLGGFAGVKISLWLGLSVSLLTEVASG